MLLYLTKEVRRHGREQIRRAVPDPFRVAAVVRLVAKGSKVPEKLGVSFQLPSAVQADM